MMCVTVHPSSSSDDELLDMTWETGDWKISAELRDPLLVESPKSEQSVHPVKIVFMNTLNRQIVIYWVDYEGTANRYKVLDPGQLYRYILHTVDRAFQLVRRACSFFKLKEFVYILFHILII
jgi:hypothetical protein